MNNDILSILQDRVGTLSKSHKLLANYLLESYDKAAFFTAAKLGNAVGVSESTVVRFAVELGYSGYPSMQRAMQEAIMKKLTAVQRIEVGVERYSEGDLLNQVFRQDIDKIRATMETVDHAAFETAVTKMLAADNIYILAVRSSATLGEYLGYYLNYMLDNVRMIHATSPSEMFERLVRVGSRDVAIAISFPRYSQTTLQAARFCAESGAEVIAITDSANSPLAAEADVSLQAKMDIMSLVDSLVAPMSLINALIVAVGQKRTKEITGTLSRLERIWDEYEVYEKGVN